MILLDNLSGIKHIIHVTVALPWKFDIIFKSAIDIIVTPRNKLL
jgi:hypothetical protein